MPLADESRDKAFDVCAEVVPGVLETMFFEALEGSPERAVLPAAERLGIAQVRFAGSAQGALCVAAPEGLLLGLTESFLACDDPAAASVQAVLVLGELANMICGNALSHYQPNGDFRLATPVTRFHKAVAAADDVKPDWVRFPLERGSLFVNLLIEPTS